MSMTIKHQGLDLDNHRRAVRVCSDASLTAIVSDLESRTLRHKWERLRLTAAREEIQRRKGIRR